MMVAQWPQLEMQKPKRREMSLIRELGSNGGDPLKWLWVLMFGFDSGCCGDGPTPQSH
jgi:hypothetical protein